MNENKESLRRKFLAGIISESQYNDKSEILSENTSKELSSKEQEILNDILGSDDSLNEAINFSDVLNKVKSYAKKGLVTTALLTAILSNPAFSQDQKEQIKQISTEVSTSESGDDLINKFDKLMAAHAPAGGEFKKISGTGPHAGKYEKSSDTLVYGDKAFHYENKDFLNPNVDLSDISENLDSKVIQQKYNWIINNMKNIQANSEEDFQSKFEKLKNEYASRFKGSEMDMKNIGGSDIVVFDHIFRQNDGFAQGPKSYKTIDGDTIEVGDRIPQGSHVVDFYGGDIKEKQDVSKKELKDTLDMVQLKMKPISVPVSGTKENIQQTIKNFKKIFSNYGEVISSGSYITLDPTYVGLVDKDKADSEIKKMNDEIKKIGDKYNLDFKGNVFSKADSVDKIK